jgi:hypothetical protein
LMEETWARWAARARVRIPRGLFQRDDRERIGENGRRERRRANPWSANALRRFVATPSFTFASRDLRLV